MDKALARNSVRLRAASYGARTIARWLSDQEGEDNKPYRPPAKPYAIHPWVRFVIDKVASSVSSVPFVVTTPDGDLIEQGPIQDMFVGLHGGLQTFLYEYVGQYELTGEAHIVFDLVDPGAGTVHVFGAVSMKALVSDDGLDLRGWEVLVPDRHGRIKRHVVAPDDVYSWIDVNLYPGTRFRGLSKIESLGLTLAEDQAAAKHNAVLLSRGGGMRGYLKTEGRLTEPQAEAAEKRFDSKYGGVANTGRVAVLGHGIDWKSIMQTNKELMVLDSRKLSKEAIFGVYNVPLSLGGETPKGAQSHEKDARETFYVNTIWPLVEQVGENLTQAFVSRISNIGQPSGSKSRSAHLRAARAKMGQNAVMIWGDMAQVPALRNWHWQQMKTLTAAVDVGIPLNEAIETMDLPFTPDKPWGDTWWVPTGKRPAELAMKEPELPPAPVAPIPPDEEENKAKAFAIKDAQEVSARWVASWGGLARKFEKSLRSFFFRQRSEMLQRIDESAPEGLKAGDVVTRDWLDDTLPDLVKENEVLIEVAEPPIRNGLNLGGAQIAAEVDGINPFEMEDAYQEFLPKRFEIIKGVNATTGERLAIQFRQATENGETLREIKQRVKNVFKEASDSRAMMIARTETAVSVNQGRKAGMKENGVQMKGWLDSKDEHTRETHLQAGIDYADGIALDLPFIVGGYPMDHPSDPSGPLSEVVNCRCALLPMEAGKAFAETVERCKGVGFVQWSEG